MRKILVIDDEKDLQEMMKDTLELANYEVIFADNGKEGLKKIYSESPDLVLLDVNLPDIDGYKVVKEIREDVLKQNLPIIMLTVRSEERDKIKGLSVGIDDYIVKPFNIAVLLARVKSVLKRTRDSVEINPLTLLPGNTAIMNEIERKMKTGKPYAVLYLDISRFKSYNDYYGFLKGDEVIRSCSQIILKNIREFGEERDFLGHLGGDDFIAVTGQKNVIKICKKIIKDFDVTIPEFYKKEDRERGFIMTKSRQGELQKFSIMTIAIGAVTNAYKKFKNVGEVSKIGTELKNYAKKSEASDFVLDRRE